MKYYKIIDGGYIVAIGTNCGGTEIMESEYDEIMTVIHNKPQATETTDYRLKTDLTWEPYEVDPPEPPSEDVDDSEALEILLGGRE